MPRRRHPQFPSVGRRPPVCLAACRVAVSGRRSARGVADGCATRVGIGENGRMTQPGSLPSALRGAVDLSSLGQKRPEAPMGRPSESTGAGTGAGARAQGALRVDVDDTTFQQALIGTQDVPAILVLWSGSHPETGTVVDATVTETAKLGGRLQVLAVDIDAAPQVRAAFQVQQVPMTVAVIAGQPMPLYPGVQPPEQMQRVFAEVVKVAEENGITGRVSVDGAAPAPEAEPLSPEHQAAYDAIEAGDFAAAVTAYEAALKKNPKDADAAAGLAQVSLMQRVQSADPQAREKAASNPDDLDAHLAVADIDLFGGHVEDSFTRLLDLVRRTADEDRERVRTRLVELFEVVGAQDDRVVKARRALMSALF